MSETLLSTHHKIKAEWTKNCKNEIFDESTKLEIIEDETKIKKVPEKIEILEQVVLKAGQKSVKCHYCDKNVDKSQLKEHNQLHEQSFFSCSFTNCDKKFRRKSSLRKHSYLHKGKFKYKCDECDIKFIDLTKFELHKNTKHKTKDSATWTCQELNCGKSFASPDYLKRHQVTHSDDYKYKCTVCDQKFKWMTSLQIHQTIHTQNKALVECKTCFKRFFNHRTLERHQKIHKNVKFKCTLCERVVSNRKDNIRRHIKHLHTEIERSEISSNIKEVQSNGKNQESGDDDDSDSGASEQADLGTDNDLEKDDSILEIEAPPKPPSPLPVINNRVNVIQTIGNPNKHQQQKPQDKPVIEETLTSALPQQPQEDKIEIKLPPKKKAIAKIQTTTSVASVPPPKPKYDPIEHYRKILGISKDDDHPTTIDDNHEDDEADQETQVFPIHWRKRTSQNFLFRR